MEIEIQLTNEPIGEQVSPPASVGAHGAWLEFRGVVRDEENGAKISALEYEAYPDMAAREIRRILESLAVKFQCLAAKVIHRVGVIPVGETAIYVGIASSHRGGAIALLAEFMNRLKQDVPIWKRRAIKSEVRSQKSEARSSVASVVKNLEDAISEINSRCQPLPAVRVPLAESFGRVLRETVCAPTDLPDCDRSTRDGYAILQNDAAEIFQIVDTLHAADWKPRQIKSGEAVRVATGAVLPCENLRVVMQENVERAGNKIKILKCENGLNLRKRGEDVKAGATLVQTGARLDAGKLALLASAGCAQPLVGPRLRVVHFTTGDEIVPPEQTPECGQVRDSNSFLIRGLLQKFPGDLTQKHLPENFESAKSQISNLKSQIENAGVLLVSGGASVGEKDFTRPLLEWLGYGIVFSQVNVRPGRPLIFGIHGNRIAFGLPGNPLSHFVCFHFFVAAALEKLIGGNPKQFTRGTLATGLEDAPNPRETLWPARLDAMGLHPLKWSSSGDVTCLSGANALIRVPANCGPMDAGAKVDFLATDF